MAVSNDANISPSPNAGFNEPWVIRLYIAGWTPASLAAVRNIRLLESDHLPAGSKVEIIDLLHDPEAGRADHVVAIPTAVRVSPLPMRRIVGALDDMDKTLEILGFR